MRRFVLVFLITSLAFAAKPDLVKRGRYLVEEMGKCQDCHTPRLPTGEPDRTKWMKGAVLDFQPKMPIPAWRGASPDLTTSSPLWKHWDEQAALKFFTTGLLPNGKPPGPPMPSYKLEREDAEAIVAYLKSLK